VCAAKQAPGSIGTESGVNFLYTPGLSSFDMAIQKEFSLAKEGKARLQLRFDAFNVFNHANFTGLNTTLNFQSYPNTAGVITVPRPLPPRHSAAMQTDHSRQPVSSQ
jgi:hypothetical protein